ncbi:MAG: hypothetical protein QG657_1531 [Acidobacteriota bacterium]|nr:hypothetical protein [Acidobacteriota bacterium]
MKNSESIFALCVKNDDCEDIEVRKIYKMIPDKRASQEGYLRIVDESGEDYLYPESYFLIIDLPFQAQELLFAA